jgi:hypothetical protein
MVMDWTPLFTERLDFVLTYTICIRTRYSTIHRQNVEVKNADGKKRRWTKRRTKKNPNGTKR